MHLTVAHCQFLGRKGSPPIARACSSACHSQSPKAMPMTLVNDAHRYISDEEDGEEEGDDDDEEYDEEADPEEEGTNGVEDKAPPSKKRKIVEAPADPVPAVDDGEEDGEEEEFDEEAEGEGEEEEDGFDDEGEPEEEGADESIKVKVAAPVAEEKIADEVIASGLGGDDEE
ncbi:uncharacterized protein BCR38DRAFT_115130 [Pseudomassariella vexata]|uniref:Uncharacterized protein n=1 Tax=Pseudomassariella vexata TaxID=1141098 RepID=A0A1Y2DBI9_9PEZI|nr:uncharacterized protein BCR38DRAFT_115130 [Pseudomassariella vexata]ORY56628.1 hypothetical protein BCR38DRAFT_115130 [Pseudomassariella vexata]